MPKFVQPEGSYQDLQNITFERADGVDIYYTTDGTMPTDQSTKYKDSITPSGGKNTIKAVAINENGIKSPVATTQYIFPDISITLKNDIFSYLGKSPEEITNMIGNYKETMWYEGYIHKFGANNEWFSFDGMTDYPKGKCTGFIGSLTKLINSNGDKQIKIHDLDILFGQQGIFYDPYVAENDTFFENGDLYYLYKNLQIWIELSDRNNHTTVKNDTHICLIVKPQ